MKKNYFLSGILLLTTLFAGAQIAVPAGSPNTSTNTFVGIGPAPGAAAATPIATLHLEGTAVNDINGERILHATLSDNTTNFLQLSNGSSGNGSFNPLLWTNRTTAGPSLYIMANITGATDVVGDNSACMIFGTRTNYNSNPVNGGGNVANRALFEWRNGAGAASLMRMYPGGQLGLGNFTATPAAQLHTTGSVRFAGLTAFPGPGVPDRTVVSDLDGDLFFLAGPPAILNCTTVGNIPVLGAGGVLNCSVMTQSTTLPSCAGPVHSGIGINGAPIGFAFSGVTCYNLGLTVNGSAFASGGLWIASDRKFKKDINNLSYGLSDIMKLRPVSYEFKTDEYADMLFP
jgi:hypothetical protein